MVDAEDDEGHYFAVSYFFFLLDFSVWKFLSEVGLETDVSANIRDELYPQEVACPRRVHIQI